MSRPTTSSNLSSIEISFTNSSEPCETHESGEIGVYHNNHYKPRKFSASRLGIELFLLLVKALGIDEGKITALIQLLPYDRNLPQLFFVR